MYVCNVSKKRIVNKGKKVKFYAREIVKINLDILKSLSYNLKTKHENFGSFNLNSRFFCSIAKFCLLLIK